MPPVYAQKNDAARRASSSTAYYGIPSSPPSRTTAQKITSSPTTAKKLADTPTKLYYGIPQSPPKPEPKEEPVIKIASTVVKKDLLEGDATIRGKNIPDANEYVFSPDSNRFVTKPEHDISDPRANTIEIFGGTSDDFRYNNSESQAPKKPEIKGREINVSVGDTFWTSDKLINIDPHYQVEGEWGDEDNGASADFTAGLQTTGSAGYEFDGDTLKVTAQGEVYYGLEANAEFHVGRGPVNAGADVEAKVGVGANATAGVVFDPRNGVSAELEAEFFAGAELNLGADAGLGDSAEVAAGLDLKAGIGAEFKGDAEISLDEIGVDLEIGATLGLGADFNIDVSISPSGIVDDAGDLFGGAKDALGSLFG